ncbi:MAG: hypothetical protein PHG25_00585 [Candidatus Pacebacteria bacterium]|nr:hypothetical protein [Candidatus Paceibacterota bacterium]
MKNKIHHQYWTEQNHQDLKLAGSSLKDMLAVALDVVSRMPPHIHLVSGPITTGGMGTIQENLIVFRQTIEHLHEQEDLNIFSQIPFEVGMIEYHKQWSLNKSQFDYCWPILHEFYGPLFATKRFSVFHFIHGYEKSIGACWEHEQCDVHGISRRYLSYEFSFSLLSQHTLPQAPS